MNGANIIVHYLEQKACTFFLSRKRRIAVFLCIKRMKKFYNMWCHAHTHKTLKVACDCNLHKTMDNRKNTGGLAQYATIPTRCLAPASNQAAASCRINPCNCRTVRASLNSLPFLSFHKCQMISMNKELRPFLFSLT